LNDLTVSRFESASPEIVFNFWTDPEELKRWWGPPGVTCQEAVIDLRLGGAYRIANLLPNGQILWIHGVFEAIETPHLLRFSRGIGLDSVPTERVTVTLKAAEGGTEVSVLHQNIPDQPTAEGHRQGWEGCLARLANLFHA